MSHIPLQSTHIFVDIDPTKIKKGRQFARSSGQGRDVDNSLWTETPAERQQRLADEVAGKRRRAVNADPEADPEAIEEGRKKRRYDEEIRKGVDEYTVGLQRFGWVRLGTDEPHLAQKPRCCIG